MENEMVRRFATSEVADDLQESGFTLGGRRLRCTVMFSDIRGFTSLVEHQSPEETIELLNAYYALMFDAISGHGGGVNQMIGDGLMAIFGAPQPLPDAPMAAVRAALDMQEMVQMFNTERAAEHKGARAHRHRHSVRRRGGRLHRHPATRHLHLHRRHRQPGRAAGGAHQGGGEGDIDGWGYARGARGWSD